MNIVLLGAPGSGKGYISNLLIDEFDYKHISTGNLLRENIKNKTELGKKIESYMNNGDLVPDALVLEVLKKALSENTKSGIIFDGYPRTIEQAVELDKLINIDIAAYIIVDKNIILDRLSTRRVCTKCSQVYSSKTFTETKCKKCGGDVVLRDDDVPEVIEKRFKKYEEQTKPLVDFYKNQGKLVNLDNGGSGQKSFNQLKEVIFLKQD